MKTVGPNFSGIHSNKSKYKNSNQSFGCYKSKYLISKEAEKEMLTYMPKTAKYFIELKKSMSEAKNIMINAIGTGLISPIFIGFNPFSKTDSDTRKYSAMRQPISAALAVLTQAALVIPFDRLIENFANEGKLGEKYDLRARQNNDYLKKIIKRENPNLSREKLKQAIDDKATSMFESSVNLVKKKGSIVVFDEAGKEVVMPKENFKKIMQKSFNLMINNLDEEISEYKDIKIPAQTKRALYINKNADKVIEFVNNTNKILKNNEDIKIIKKEIGQLIKNIEKTGHSSELLKLANETKYLSTKNDIQGKLNKTLDKISRYKDLTEDQVKNRVKNYSYTKYINKSEVEKLVIEGINEKFNRNKPVDQLFKEVKDISEQLNHGIKNDSKAHATISKILEGTKASKKIKDFIKDIDSKEHKYIIQDKDLIREVVKDHIDNTKSMLKGFKAQTGLIVSLAMLPVTCSILNYIYPRFMEKFFPNLTHSKHPKKEGA